MAQIKFIIEGQEYNPPVEWQDMGINASWVSENTQMGQFVQPAITAQSYTFVNEAAAKIIEYIDAGMTTGPGILRGMLIKIMVTDPVDGTSTIFEGMLDFLEEYEIMRPDFVRCKITRPDNFELLDKRLEALTYGLLKEKGLTQRTVRVRVPYVVQKINREYDVLWLTITTLVLTREVIDAIKTLGGLIAEIAAITTTIPGIIKLALQIIYLAALIIVLLKYVIQLAETLVPFPRIQRAMSLRTLLQLPLTHLGLSLNSNIALLDKVHYIPSRQPYFHKKGSGTATYLKQGQDLEAIPSLQDYGYRCSEIFRLVADMFYAQVTVDGGKVHIFPEGDPFWVRSATYVLPNILLDNYSYNVNEMKATTLLSFQTDASDGWTVEDFKGTNYEINLASSQTIEPQQRLLKGIRDIRFPVALGSRKAQLDDIEDSLQSVGNVLGNKIITGLLKRLKKANAFLKAQNLPHIRNGVLRVENRHWNLPKLVYLQGGEIPANHRDLLSARALYNQFHSYRSFAGPNFTGQRKVFRNIKIPFGIADYNKVINNAFFKTADGRTGHFLKLEWKFPKDTAMVSFEIIEPYVKTITETTHEP